MKLNLVRTDEEIVPVKFSDGSVWNRSIPVYYYENADATVKLAFYANPNKNYSYLYRRDGTNRAGKKVADAIIRASELGFYSVRSDDGRRS